MNRTKRKQKSLEVFNFRICKIAPKFRFKMEGGEEPILIEMVRFLEGMTL